MPGSQFISKKKYAVVTFIDENPQSCEVIPTNWIISESKTKWPSIASSSIITKLIKECSAPSSNWTIINIKTNSFTNSFSKAMRKATELEGTSHLSSDSSENASETMLNQRKRQLPVRYRTEKLSSNLMSKRRKTENNCGTDYAASMKFKGAEREDLADMFGKSLAGASDWNRRKFRPSDNAIMASNLSLDFTD